MKKFLGLILLMLLPCSALSMWGQTGQQMKLISYNIWNGFEGDSLRRARFIEWTQKQAADIFVLTELVGFKEKDLKTLGQVCGYPYAAIVKEEGYPVGVLSKQPIEVIKKQVEGFWHGMMHVKTAGVDVIATHLSPFEWKYRLSEAQQIVDYIQANHLKDYYVAGDLNAHSPLDADEIAKHDTLLANMQRPYPYLHNRAGSGWLLPIHIPKAAHQGICGFHAKPLLNQAVLLFGVVLLLT